MEFAGLDPTGRRRRRWRAVQLISRPPHRTSSTSTGFYWSGTDPDGTIDHYDYILVDHPSPRASSGGDSSAVVVTVPLPDDPRWLGTSATDSIFVTQADTLLRDPRPGPGEDDETIRNSHFERWHTLFVRAVDNEGAADATPDYRTFNSTNIAPIVHLSHPVRPGKRFESPSTVVFNWDGIDPTGTGNTLEPVAARWVLIPTRTNVANDHLSFPDSHDDVTEALLDIHADGSSIRRQGSR